jgi:OOP family OmpA-OmpF porin
MAYKYRIAFFLFFILWVSNSLLAQTDNLVPNPSFEEHNSLPYDVGDGKSCITTWDFPNFPGGGDYYHSDSQSKKGSTKKNHFGSQDPHSGNAYAGICISKECREYLQIKLIRSLTKNKEYEIKIYISCADKLYLSTVNEFNIIFSKNQFNIIGNDFLLTPPELKFVKQTKYRNKTNWQELSMIYTANGTEQWMTFGSFPYVENEKEFGEIFGLSKYAHYYVDDVSITALKKDSFTIIPPIVEHKEPEIEKEFVSGETYVLDNIEFEIGKSTLLDESFPELDNLILYLLKNPLIKLNIIGHTDNIGNATDNLKLSRERASMVKQYLTSNKAIKKELIFIEGKGDAVPLNTNATEVDREKNRRVEFSFY